MAVQHPWEKEEAAILVDVCARIRKGETGRMKAEGEVSSLLRSRALRLGRKPDVYFRNRYAVHARMTEADTLMDGKAIEDGENDESAQVIAAMVELAQTNREDFDRILARANEECILGKWPTHRRRRSEREAPLEIPQREEKRQESQRETPQEESGSEKKEEKAETKRKRRVHNPVWDEEEAALLIDAVDRVREGKSDPEKEEEELSALLRERARRAGREIGDVFRSKSSVHARRVVATAAREEMELDPRVVDRSTKVILRVMERKKTDPDGFEELLQNAKEACGGGEEKDKKTTLRNPPWDKEEAAILIDAYVRSQSGEMSLGESEKQVSSWLRQRAIFANKKIDDTFRNKNGIHNHMIVVAGLMENKPLARTSQLLVDMVELYNSNRDEFDRILNRAKVECKISTNPEQGEMPKRNPNWEQEEVVLLIDAYVRSRDGEMSRGEAEEYVSKLLRQRALRKGINIESNFRNRKGVSMRLWIIDRLMNNQSVDKKYTLYVNTVELYRSDRTKFDRILNRAREECALSEGVGEPERKPEIVTETTSQPDLLRESENKPEFLKAKATSSIPENVASRETKNENKSADPVSNLEKTEKLQCILQKQFAEGLRPNRAIDRDRFCFAYEEAYGEEAEEDDERLIAKLREVGTLRDGRIFPRTSDEQQDLLREIEEKIQSMFDGGASCLYLSCLLARYEEPLAETLHIYDEESLVSVLLADGEKPWRRDREILLLPGRRPEVQADVCAAVRGALRPVTYTELRESLWYIPFDRVKRTLTQTPGIVNVAAETYLWAENLPVSGEELAAIREQLRGLLLQRSYLIDTEWREKIGEICPSFILDTAEYPTWGLRNALAYFLRKDFSFRGPVISAKGEEIRTAEIFTDFCQSRESVTVEELRELAQELKRGIDWDAVYREMVRVSESEFLRRSAVHFDVEAIDAILDQLIPGDYVPIRRVDLFLHFPEIGVKWNSYVLESYVTAFSEQFHLLHAGFSATDCCGAIVRKTSKITDYRTLLVDVLSRDASWQTRSDALSLVVREGYQKTRRCGGIADIMREAKIKRDEDSNI